MSNTFFKIMLSILLYWGWIGVGIASPSVALHSEGAIHVAPAGKMYVQGGIHVNEGATATVSQEGLMVLTGDFIHDASTNVFTTVYDTAQKGTVEFRGTTDQEITTTKLAYTPGMGGSTSGKMDRKTMFLKFPDFKINNGNKVIITPSMGVSINNLAFTSGNLLLKSDENGGNNQDASLLVDKNVDYTGGHMEIERNVRYNMGVVTGENFESIRYFGFAAPMKNMYLDYFTDHWVFDQRMNDGAGGYDYRRYQKFEPGIGYFVIVRGTPNIGEDDFIQNGLLIKNEHFLFNRTFYSDFFDWYWTVPAEDNPVPQEMLNTGNISIPGGLKQGDNYLGNPYTCALDINALFTHWSGSIVPSVWVWSGQAGNWLTITNDMSTMDNGEKVIPSQQMFVIEGVNNVGSFNIPASARTHNAHRFLRSDSPLNNELLIEVRDAELDNYTRMAIGLRSWGKLSGDDESDAKWLVNEDTNTPQVYAVVPGNKDSSATTALTINAIPEDTRSTNFDFVPAKIDGNRKYIMRITRQESLETGMAILIDKKEKKEINLFENDTYEFFAGKNDDTQRFTIRFAPENDTDTENINAVPRDINLNNQVLYITNNRDSDIGKSVEIYNASGLLVFKNEVTHTGTNIYDVNLLNGVYIVKSGETIKKIKK